MTNGVMLFEYNNGINFQVDTTFTSSVTGSCTCRENSHFACHVAINYSYSESSLIGPPLGSTMSGPINEILIIAAAKGNGPIKNVTLLYLKLQNAYKISDTVHMYLDLC